MARSAVLAAALQKDVLPLPACIRGDQANPDRSRGRLRQFGQPVEPAAVARSRREPFDVDGVVNHLHRKPAEHRPGIAGDGLGNRDAARRPRCRPAQGPRHQRAAAEKVADMPDDRNPLHPGHAQEQVRLDPVRMDEIRVQLPDSPAQFPRVTPRGQARREDLRPEPQRRRELASASQGAIPQGGDRRGHRSDLHPHAERLGPLDQWSTLRDDQVQFRPLERREGRGDQVEQAQLRPPEPADRIDIDDLHDALRRPCRAAKSPSTTRPRIWSAATLGSRRRNRSQSRPGPSGSNPSPSQTS